jgi:hypothetical protein
MLILSPAITNPGTTNKAINNRHKPAHIRRFIIIMVMILSPFFAANAKPMAEPFQTLNIFLKTLNSDFCTPHRRCRYDVNSVALKSSVLDCGGIPVRPFLFDHEI